MEPVLRYFPQLSTLQQQQLQQLGAQYADWNQKINLISRKDMDALYEHHILHSMSIAKLFQFHPDAKILDLGTGGGLPGLPLAILFPKTHFTLIDGTFKKIMAVKEIAAALELENVTALHIRAEELKQKFEFVVTRGVAPLPKLMEWCARLFDHKERHAYPNGLLALKGGQLKTELEALPKSAYYELFPIRKFFSEPFFEEKYIVYVQR